MNEMIVLLLVVGGLLLWLSLGIAIDVVRSVRQERRRQQIEAARLSSEARLQAVTYAAMHHMLRVARQAQREHDS